MQLLDGRVVIITGASSGLGAQLARAVGEAGGVPVLAARRADRLAALTEEIPSADPVSCDVTDETDRERLIDGVMDRHGRLDGLINNAGAGATAPALRTSTETFARVLDLNLVAPFALSCLAAKRMRKDGGGRSIINIASVMGLRSLGQIPDAAYVASKAGDHRVDARARIAVGSLRDTRERRRARFLRLGDERRSSARTPSSSPTSCCRGRHLGGAVAPASSTTPCCSCSARAAASSPGPC